jgi:DNA invertase Pin-like site-specific DNA recombinase
MKAAIYVRVSTPGQAINGESLDMQKERLIEYAKAQGWDIYKTYEGWGLLREGHRQAWFSGDVIRCPAK